MSNFIYWIKLSYYNKIHGDFCKNETRFMPHLNLILLLMINMTVTINSLELFHMWKIREEGHSSLSFSSVNELFWLSVVRRLFVRLSACPSVCKLFTFFDFSRTTKLAQNILEWRGFKFLRIKDNALSQGEVIMK